MVLHRPPVPCWTVASSSPSPTSAAAARWAGAGTTTASCWPRRTPSPTSSPAPSTWSRPAGPRRSGWSPGAARPAACSWARWPTWPRTRSPASSPQVPFVDALTTILDPSLPLTVTEWEEWGNPLETAEVYAYMKSYAPYENVRRPAYPADPGADQPQRHPGALPRAGQVGRPAARARARRRRTCSRPRWAPATAARAAATTPGRKRPSSSPGSSTVLPAPAFCSRVRPAVTGQRGGGVRVAAADHGHHRGRPRPNRSRELVAVVQPRGRGHRAAGLGDQPGGPGQTAPRWTVISSSVTVTMPSRSGPQVGEGQLGQVRCAARRRRSGTVARSATRRARRRRRLSAASAASSGSTPITSTAGAQRLDRASPPRTRARRPPTGTSTAADVGQVGQDLQPDRALARR